MVIFELQNTSVRFTLILNCNALEKIPRWMLASRLLVHAVASKWPNTCRFFYFVTQFHIFPSAIAASSLNFCEPMSGPIVFLNTLFASNGDGYFFSIGKVRKFHLLTFPDATGASTRMGLSLPGPRPARRWGPATCRCSRQTRPWSAGSGWLREIWLAKSIRNVMASKTLLSALFLPSSFFGSCTASCWWWSGLVSEQSQILH